VQSWAPTLLEPLAQDLGNGTSQLVACGLKGQTVTQRPGFKQLTTRLPVDVAARRAGPRAPPARLAHTPTPSAPLRPPLLSLSDDLMQSQSPAPAQEPATHIHMLRARARQR